MRLTAYNYLTSLGVPLRGRVPESHFTGTYYEPLFSEPTQLSSQDSNLETLGSWETKRIVSRCKRD